MSSKNTEATRTCDPGKHVMVPAEGCDFDVCEVCERYYIPTRDLSLIKEYSNNTCRFCNKDKDFESCTC